MIPIAPDRIRRIAMRPFVENEMIVERIFSHRPAIEKFVHHQEAHAVAKIEKLRRRRIVRRANRIHAQ